MEARKSRRENPQAGVVQAFAAEEWFGRRAIARNIANTPHLSGSRAPFRGALGSCRPKQFVGFEYEIVLNCPLL